MDLILQNRKLEEESDHKLTETLFSNQPQNFVDKIETQEPIKRETNKKNKEIIKIKKETKKINPTQNLKPRPVCNLNDYEDYDDYEYFDIENKYLK